MTHSKSRVVFEILKEAKNRNTNFHVFVCESMPDRSGWLKYLEPFKWGFNVYFVAYQRLLFAEDLKKIGISVTVILDAAVGSIMERINFVLLGAEGVVESGGIINKIGSTSIAICAKMLNKPVYVGVESVKFVRFYPLNNRDIPDEFKVLTLNWIKLKKSSLKLIIFLKYKHSTIMSGKDLKVEHPLIDYTDPSLLTLLFTDIGILTPSAVSDELVKLYL